MYNHHIMCGESWPLYEVLVYIDYVVNLDIHRCAITMCVERAGRFTRSWCVLYLPGAKKDVAVHVIMEGWR